MAACTAGQHHVAFEFTSATLQHAGRGISALSALLGVIVLGRSRWLRRREEIVLPG